MYKTKTLLIALLAALALLVAPGAHAAQGKITLNEGISKLVVAPENTQNPYNRKDFKHWISSKKYPGCSIRYEVLIDEGKNVKVSKGCYVTGKWLSYYDKQTFTDPRKLDIDHMVPLHEAWKSGAYKWDAEKRQKYANDVTYPYTLVAVSAQSNRSKSDKDPANWMPAYGKCKYLAHWIGVKLKWKLTIDLAEKKALTSESKKCSKQKITL
jgi:hypothetical protein